MKVIFILVVSLRLLVLLRDIDILFIKEEVTNISKHKEEKPSDKPGDGRRDYNV